MSVLGSENQNYSTSDDARKKFEQVASLTSDSTILGMFVPYLQVGIKQLKSDA